MNWATLISGAAPLALFLAMFWLYPSPGWGRRTRAALALGLAICLVLTAWGVASRTRPARPLDSAEATAATGVGGDVVAVFEIPNRGRYCHEFGPLDRVLPGDRVCAKFSERGPYLGLWREPHECVTVTRILPSGESP